MNSVHKCREMHEVNDYPYFRYEWTDNHGWVRFLDKSELTMWCTKCQYCGKFFDLNGPVPVQNQVTIE